MIKPNLKSSSESTIQLAVQLLQQGKLVAIPTETVYGLGANAKDPVAVKKIFAAKGRPADHPLIVHIPDKCALAEWAIDIPDMAWQLAEHFWPGPLTLVLKKQPHVPFEVTGGQDTVGLRVPRHPVALALLKAFNGGIAAPSANRYCRISPTQASDVAEELGDAVDLILDGGVCTVGLESSIIDLSGERPKLLRPGQIPVSELEGILGQPLITPQISAVRVSGMNAVHYAPKTAAFLCTGEQLSVILDQDPQVKRAPGIGVLAYHTQANDALVDLIIQMPNEASEYAHCLYGHLRTMDKNPNVDVILIEQPPQSEAWQAVNDRLHKAAKALSQDSPTNEIMMATK